MNFIKRRLRRNNYRQKAIHSRSIDKLIAGSGADRLKGLGPLLALAKDKTVLDVGCHDGGVAAAFARASAACIDGFDISKHAIIRAEQRMQACDVKTRFSVCDLSKGRPALESMDLLARYDIVCYLGVHHHLVEQMSLRKYKTLVAAIAAMTRQVLVARTPDINHRLLEQILGDNGLVQDRELITAEAGVGSMRSYVRRSLVDDD